MKTLLFGAALYVVFWANTPLKYYTQDINDNIVINALNQWDLKHLTYVKVKSPEEANIVFKKTNTLSTPNRYGESNYFEVRVNGKYKLNEKELTNLISHEFGHYLSLSHNDKPRSIMNNKTKLSNKMVTQEDKDGVYFLTLRLIVAKFFGALYQYSS